MEQHPPSLIVVLAVRAEPVVDREQLAANLRAELAARSFALETHIMVAEQPGWVIVRAHDADTDAPRLALCLCEELTEATTAVVAKYERLLVAVAGVHTNTGQIEMDYPAQELSRDIQERINQNGRVHGCHTCGTKNPGTVSGNFIVDWQRPSVVNEPGQAQQWYPHCLECNRHQSVEVRAVRRDALHVDNHD